MEQTISERIRQYRTALGYSQEYVAKKLKITQQAYSSIESNPFKATLERLKQLADILKVELIVLICDEKTFVQTNINQQGGKAATQMIVNEATETSVYERYITDLKSEIDFLKKVVENLQKK